MSFRIQFDDGKEDGHKIEEAFAEFDQLIVDQMPSDIAAMAEKDSVSMIEFAATLDIQPFIENANVSVLYTRDRETKDDYMFHLKVSGEFQFVKPKKVVLKHCEVYISRELKCLCAKWGAPSALCIGSMFIYKP